MTTADPQPSEEQTTAVAHAADAAADAVGAELVVRPSSVPSITQRVLYARELAKAGVLPPWCRNRPGDVLFAIEYGRDLGLSAAGAIVNLHVIDGKPSASAHLMGALVRRAGHKLRVWATTDETGSPVGHCQIIRHDDPGFTFESTWTMQRAADANLVRWDTATRSWKAVKPRSAWDTFRPAMLKSRALAECTREACAEVMLGTYTHDELDRLTGTDGDVVDAEVLEELTPQQTQQQTAPPPQLSARDWTAQGVYGVLARLDVEDGKEPDYPEVRKRAGQGVATLAERKLSGCPVPLNDVTAALIGWKPGEYPAQAILVAVSDHADAMLAARAAADAGQADDADVADAEVVPDVEQPTLEELPVDEDALQVEALARDVWGDVLKADTADAAFAQLGVLEVIDDRVGDVLVPVSRDAATPKVPLRALIRQRVDELTARDVS